MPRNLAGFDCSASFTEATMIFPHCGWLFAPDMCNDTFTQLGWGIWKLRRIFGTISSPFCVTLELPAKFLLDSKRASCLLTFCGRRATTPISVPWILPFTTYIIQFPLENLPAASQLHTKLITRSGNYYYQPSKMTKFTTVTNKYYQILFF